MALKPIIGGPGFSQSGSNAVESNEATLEAYGGSPIIGFDNATAFAAARDDGKNIVFLSASTYEIHSAVNWPKFNGQYIRGLNSRTSIVSVTTDTHGFALVAASVNDPRFGAGVFGAAFKNFTLLGPGTFNAGAGTFSGSTKDGIHAENGGATYYGDFESLEDMHIESFLRCVYINGIGNTTFVRCAFEYAGSGLVVGNTATNSLTSVNLVTSNCATANISIAGGSGGNFGLGDTNANAAGSGTQIILTGGTNAFQGGNFEGCSPSGNVVSGNAANALFNGGRFLKGSGTDNTAVLNTNGNIVLNACSFSGYTTPYTAGAFVALGPKSLVIPGGTTAGGISSNSPGIRIGNMFVRADQIESNDLAFFNQNTDLLLLKAGGDIEALINGKGFVVQSPNSTRYRLTVSDIGVVTATSL